MTAAVMLCEALGAYLRHALPLMVSCKIKRFFQDKLYGRPIIVDITVIINYDYHVM